MKKIWTVFTLMMVFAAVACDDNDGKEACEAYAMKCPAGTTGAVACSAERVNGAANGGEVEDCIQTAGDCAAATTCYGGLR